MSEQTSGTQAVDRAAMLVATVVRADAPLAFGDLLDQCQLPKSTTSRLLAALERTELLERDEDGNYAPGPLFWQHAMRHDPWDRLVEIAQPVLEAVGAATSETVNLGAPRGLRVVHLAQVDSTYLLGTRDWTQQEVPPHASSLGKVLYAYAALDVPARLRRVTPQTITDRHAFEQELIRVRSRGYAVTIDELEIGLTGIAAPVFDGSGQVIAALGLSGPTQRLSAQTETFGRLLVDQAARLTESLRRTNHVERAGIA